MEKKNIHSGGIEETEEYGMPKYQGVCQLDINQKLDYNNLI